MKKFLMVLLSIAFVLNLAIVIGLIGGYGSPRRALYTITDWLGLVPIGTALGFAEYRMKNVIDRILPLLTMLLAVEDGQMRHVARYKKRLRWGMVYAARRMRTT